MYQFYYFSKKIINTRERKERTYIIEGASREKEVNK